MHPSTTTQGKDLQYAVIGRLNMEHDAYGLSPQQIVQHIVDALDIYVHPSDIIHIPPNFIIHLDSPEAQATILDHSTLHTNYFQLQLLPWSKEHEWAQLPWITAHSSATSEIIIDPLTILPVVPKRRKHPGITQLKDTFAATIPRNYDLRAPDHSYLIISELRDFYQTKSRIFANSKNITSQVHHIMHEFYSIAETQILDLCSYMQPVHTTGIFTESSSNHSIITDLSNAIQSKDTTLAYVDNFANSILKYADVPLDLQGFKHGPPPTEIAVPSTYTDRLKVIFNATIDRIHRTKPLVETLERQENRFETYITIGKFTRRYFGDHEKTATAMEADAIYYSLKHITNVQGYRIIDLNFTTLARLVTDIDAWNARINMFQLFNRFCMNQLHKICENIDRTCQEMHHQESDSQKFKRLSERTSTLLQTLDQYSTHISSLCLSFNSCKQEYHDARVGIYSPTRSYYRWSRATRPHIA